MPSPQLYDLIPFLADTKRKRLNFSLKIEALLMSGWQDSNLRPPGPKPGAMTGLRYIPNYTFNVAVRAGFEPAVQFPVRQFSKLVVSASHPPHLGAANVPKLFIRQMSS